MLSISIEFPNIFHWKWVGSKVDLVFGGQIRPNVLKKQIKWYLNVFLHILHEVHIHLKLEEILVIEIP